VTGVQTCALPIWVVPSDPCKTRAVRTQTRRRIEVISRNKHSAAVFAIKAKARYGVHRLLIGEAVVFSDTDHSTSMSIHRSICIPHVDFRSDWSRFRSRFQHVDALVGKVREVDNIIGDDEAAASILVHSGPSIERGRRKVYDPTISRVLHDCVASLLFWTQLPPVDLARGKGHLEKLGCRGSKLRRDRRLPRTVRYHFLLRHQVQILSRHSEAQRVLITIGRAFANACKLQLEILFFRTALSQAHDQ